MHGLAACFIGALMTCGAAARAVPPDGQTKLDPQIAAGRKVYEREKCAACHQIAGQGNSRFKLDGVGARLTSKEIGRWITDTARMEAALPRLPAVRMSATKYRLKPPELDALVAYLQTLK